MLMLALQIVVLLGVIILPLNSLGNKKRHSYKVDRDTSSATFVINEDGELQQIGSSDKNSSISN